MRVGKLRGGMVRGEGERVKVGGERGDSEGKECEANTNSRIKG